MACAASDVASIDAVELGEASDMIQLREEVARLKAENKELKEANSVTSVSLGESNGFDASTCGTSNGADGKLHLSPPKATCGAGKRCTITAVEKIAYKREIQNCVAGKYATAENNIVARACKSCPNGKKSAAGASSCDTCTAGKHSNAAKTACSWCANGKISANGASSCSSCAAGKKAVGRTSCNTCPAGTYTGANSIHCHNCSDGKYQDAAGQTSCKNCPSGRYSQGPSPYTACTLFSHKNHERCWNTYNSPTRLFRRRLSGSGMTNFHSTQTEDNCKKACAKHPECKYANVYNKNSDGTPRTHRRRTCVLNKAGCTMQTNKKFSSLYTKP
jgi:hypothetical protein